MAEHLAKEGFDVTATYTLLYNASLLVESGMGIAVCLDDIVATGEGTPFYLCTTIKCANYASISSVETFCTPIARMRAFFTRHARPAGHKRIAKTALENY